MTEPKAAPQDDSSTGGATEQAFQSAVAPLGGKPKSEKVAGSIPAHPAGAAPAMPERYLTIIMRGETITQMVVVDAAYAEALQAERDYWKKRFHEDESEAINIIKAKLDRAQAALKKYGAHPGGCAFSGGTECICGLDQAIKESEK